MTCLMRTYPVYAVNEHSGHWDMKTNNYPSNTTYNYGREPTALCFGLYLNHHQAVQSLQEGIMYNNASNVIKDGDLRLIVIQIN